MVEREECCLETKRPKVQSFFVITKNNFHNCFYEMLDMFQVLYFIFLFNTQQHPYNGGIISNLIS